MRPFINLADRLTDKEKDAIVFTSFVLASPNMNNGLQRELRLYLYLILRFIGYTNERLDLLSTRFNNLLEVVEILDDLTEEDKAWFLNNLKNISHEQYLSVEDILKEFLDKMTLDRALHILNKKLSSVPGIIPA